MDDRSAIVALGALAQRHRLKLFKLLVRRAPDGLAAGQISDALHLSPSALSFHLAQLQAAGLIRRRRDGRRLVYRADTAGMRRLMAFLTADCCDGRPELCGLAAPAREKEPAA